MVVAAVGIAVNGATAWQFASGRKGDINLRGAFLHMAYDALVSVGVVAAGGVILLTGWIGSTRWSASWSLASCCGAPGACCANRSVCRSSGA